VSVTGDANILPTGVAATGVVSSVGVGVFITVNAIGSKGTGQVGSANVELNAIINVTGVSATANTAQVLVWGAIVPNQNPSYNPINPSSTPSWTDESPSQSPGWDDIAA